MKRPAWNTGYFSYVTHEDGLCTFTSASQAVVAAQDASERCGERVTVRTPDGQEYAVQGVLLPSHEEQCMDPDCYPEDLS